MDEVRAHLMAEHGFTLQCEGSVFVRIVPQLRTKALSTGADRTKMRTLC